MLKRASHYIQNNFHWLNNIYLNMINPILNYINKKLGCLTLGKFQNSVLGLKHTAHTHIQYLYFLLSLLLVNYPSYLGEMGGI